jgi:hypothetical protein
MNGEAQYLHDNELLAEIFATIERDAIELCINAPMDADEIRRCAMGEVRAIRSVQRKLKALLAKTNPKPGAVV